MQLFSGNSNIFIRQNRDNTIATSLKTAFFNYFGYNPSPNEVMSWRNSLLRLSLIMVDSSLTDHGVFIEYQLPLSSKRLDCMICGNNEKGKPEAVIIELKQWETCRLSDYDSERVITWVGGGNRDVLHPSIQAGNYSHYLKHFKTVFYEEENPVNLSACSYLHNYTLATDDVLIDQRFSTAITQYPLFTLGTDSGFKEYLSTHLSGGNGEEILERIEKSEHRPSPKLMQQLSETIRGKLSGDTSLLGGGKDYILLDDQLIVYDSIISIVTKGLHKKKKYSIIVKGGPGTGKSVIALQLMANLTLKGFITQYATGSKSFTQTLRKIAGNQFSGFFKYFMSYYNALPDSLDVLILDEAHRIREKTVVFRQYTGEIPQVEELIKAARITLFLIDDDQVVRPGEIGSVEHIKTYARKMNCEILEFELETQFRCSGSDAFIQWVNNTLHIRKTANALWEGDENFEFRIFNDPQNMENAIRYKVEEGFTGRMTAGFCWPWSKELNEDGSLKEDVKIGEYIRPWNARDDVTGLRRDIPKSPFWAYDPNGINQVGCIYTAQGFEFDYVGVIFGNDLIFDFESNIWTGKPENSFDTQVRNNKKQFTQMVKNTYRVLLTRGIKGCYVCFMDKDTEKFFRSRIINL
jgi:DUF2075 family protein